MDELVTYLRLTQEFGGEEFGPFEKLDTCLGSDHNSCDIYIPENFGTLPIHAKIIRKGPTDVILTPAETAAEIFLWRGGRGRAEQVYGPTAMRHGDEFSLVTPQGPRFIIEFRELPEEIKQSRVVKKKSGTGRDRLNKDAMATEAKRQIWTTLLVTGPAQIAQRAWTFVRSGAIFQPRNIILGLTIVGGYIMAGTFACQKKSLVAKSDTLKEKFEDCQAQNKALGGTEDLDKWKAVGNIVGSDIANALREDSKLRKETQKEMKRLFQNKPEWVSKTTPYGKDYAKWIKTVRGQKDSRYDKSTRMLLQWMMTDSLEEGSWNFYRNGDNDKRCGRGSLRLSYRQATHLGLKADPSAPYLGKVKKILDGDSKRELVKKHLNELGFDPEEIIEETDVFRIDSPDATANKHCLYKKSEGTEIREDNKELLKELSSQIGPKAKNMPPKDVSWGATTRIGKVFAAELENGDFSGKTTPIVFKDGHLGKVMGDTAGAEWVIQKTAKVIARSVAIPCLVFLEGTEETKGMYLDEEQTPDVMSCLILNYEMSKDD